MRTHLRRTCIVLTGALTMLSAAWAGERVTGTWSLVPTRSDFAGQTAIQSGTVTINSREGNIYISRNFVFDSPDQTFWYNFSTDGREGATIKSKERDVRSKARWDDGTLKVETTDSSGKTTEHYSLQPDGSLLLHLTRPGKAPVTMTFARRE